ncbi:MAG: MBL fold metallo-hydrolase [Verrucomicrobia bacterium]|nr:MBL fold metallo-hydrolase [Verrucomicrobiota bacterium]
MRTTAFILSALLTTGTLALAQRDFSNVEIKTTHVAGNVYMLEGAGGNIGVSVGPDGLLIVDDQFLPLAPKIEAALEKLDKGPLKFVLNTHWHGDHTGGNPHFGRKAHLIAHTNVRKRLADKSDTPKEALPVITFDDSLAVHFNGEEIRVLHLPPGHTDGDSVIHFTKSGVVHMGDQFFSGKFPFIDLGSGGDVAGYVKNVETVLQKLPAGAKIIPGHGPLATREDLEKFHQMLVETTGLVRKAIDEGKTLEQVKAAGLPEKWKDWGTGFINTSRWLEIVFNNLDKK